jgi:hypothetical protein
MNEPLVIRTAPPAKAIGAESALVLTVVDRRTGRRTHVRRTHGVLWVDNPAADQGQLKRWIREGLRTARV